MNQETDTKEKIILPKNLQREMIKFFLGTSMPKIAETDKVSQQTSLSTKEAREWIWLARVFMLG